MAQGRLASCGLRGVAAQGIAWPAGRRLEDHLHQALDVRQQLGEAEAPTALPEGMLVIKRDSVPEHQPAQAETGPREFVGKVGEPCVNSLQQRRHGRRARSFDADVEGVAQQARGAHLGQEADVGVRRLLVRQGEHGPGDARAALDPP